MNLNDNDDVFSDDDDESNESSSAEQQPAGNFEAVPGINIAGQHLPGYLVKALQQYLGETGLNHKTNTRIPYASVAFAEFVRHGNFIYEPHPSRTALGAMYEVLDELTEGYLSVKYRLAILAEGLVEYRILGDLANSLFVQLEQINVPMPTESIRLLRMLKVYIDIIQYHRDVYLDEYLQLCQEHQIDPDIGIVEKSAYSSTYPGLIDNSLIFRLESVDDSEIAEIVMQFFDTVNKSVTDIIHHAVRIHDEANVESNQV